MSKKILVKDIMTTKVITIAPEAYIMEAAKIISDHNLDGLPVIDKDHNLLGILTEYDLITKTSSLKNSLLQRIVYELYNNKPVGNEESKSISRMKVKDIMNAKPIYLDENATFDEAVDVFITHHRVNPIIVIDSNKKFIGIVSRFDILRPLNLLSYKSYKKS